MATTTPNYGWTVPTSSDLVKNGATAIETLGDSVDDSLWNSGYGQAGKNKIINGDMSVWQRSASQTTTVSSVFLVDRFMNTISDGTCTFSVQTFTAGTAPVAGYESKNYLRMVTTGQTLTTAVARIDQKIEDVRTFAGQTITFSLWAQAGTGTPSISVELQQNFGTGGSPSSTVNTLIASPAKQTISTSWARYSFTIAVPSISGKTLGTNNDSFLQACIYFSAGSSFNARTGSLGIQSNTFNIWGVQAEYGSKATPFQTASGGSLQGELAMCQRYYWRVTPGSNAYGRLLGGGGVTSTTRADFGVRLPVTMRTGPTSLDVSSPVTSVRLNGTAAYTISAITLDTPTNTNTANIYVTSTVLVAGQAINLDADNNSNAFIGFSAEL
jgi:hypothetical protein